MKRKLHGCLKLCLHCKPVFQCSFALMALLMLQCKQREGRGVFSWCHLYRSDSNCGRELTTAKYSGMVTTPQSLLSLSAVLFSWTKMCLKSTFSLKKEKSFTQKHNKPTRSFMASGLIELNITWEEVRMEEKGFASSKTTKRYLGKGRSSSLESINSTNHFLRAAQPQPNLHHKLKGVHPSPLRSRVPRSVPAPTSVHARKIQLSVLREQLRFGVPTEIQAVLTRPWKSCGSSVCC